MLPIQRFSASVISDLVRRQPASKEKTRFVWQLAVGPALARATTVELVNRVLIVRATDPRWMREIDRAHDMILARVQHLLGEDTVSRMQFSD